MKMKKLVILLLLCSGCGSRLTIEQARLIAKNTGIRSEVRWYSVRGNPWADGDRIYIDLDWVHNRGMNNRLSNLLLHEEYHNRGMFHCKTKSCLMYHEYQYDIILGAPDKKLCEQCKKLIYR